MGKLIGKIIYLDNASTTKPSRLVLDAMEPYMSSEYGNPGTLYPFGIKARDAIINARWQVATFMGAWSSDQILFTAGGTEANNMVFNHALQTGVKHIVTSKLEHSSVLRSVENCEQHGCKVTFVKNDENGVVDFNDLENIIKHSDEKPGLVSIMYMNNEIGSTNQIKQIASMCAYFNIPFHVDGVQAAGCVPLNVQEIGCDFMSISSHKIHGPKGVGALYVKDRKIFTPMIFGGSSQEFGLRGGTENVAGIIGFGKACDVLTSYERDHLDIRIFLTTLKRAFWKSIKDASKRLKIEDKLHCNASSSESYGKILSLRFDGVDAESLVLYLGTKGVCISAGSACTSHEQKPSHVLTGIGLTDAQARETVRISFSNMNSMHDIKEAAAIIADAASTLLSIS